LLVRQLKDRNAEVEIDAVGGSAMARAGANVVESRDSFSVLGLAEGVGTISAHYRALRRLRKRFAAGLYDLTILIDYPGFHLRVAAAAHHFGVPVLYYIAPQLWAWGSWRGKAVRNHVQQVAAVLPFEEDYFRSLGVEAEFVGHPLLDRDELPSRQDARAALELTDNVKVLGLFPGSRKAEVGRLWPNFRDAAKRLRESIPSLYVVVAAVDGIEYPGAPEFKYLQMASTTALAAADAALCKSGTATLEAVISETPMVIAYRMHPVSYGVARRLIRVPHVGLVNLIAGREVCPEFLQFEATPLALADAVAPLMDAGSEETSLQRRAFAQVRSKLGGPGATERVAELAERMIA